MGVKFSKIEDLVAETVFLRELKSFLQNNLLVPLIFLLESVTIDGIYLQMSQSRSSNASVEINHRLNSVNTALFSTRML